MADDDNQPNPYAAPRTAFGDPSDAIDDGPNDYESERRPVVLCILLTFLSLGFYPAIWLLRRNAFLDRLNAPQRLGTALPTVVIVMNTLAFSLCWAARRRRRSAIF